MCIDKFSSTVDVLLRSALLEYHVPNRENRHVPYFAFLYFHAFSLWENIRAFDLATSFIARSCFDA